MSLSLADKTALVTGASSGIGWAAALALAGAGARVGLAARRTERLEALAAEIRALGGQALVLACDVTDEAACTDMVRRMEHAFGDLDILVANAGIGVAAPFQNTTPAEYRRMVDVNILGFLYPVHAALPGMRARGQGHIVALSSGTGRYIHPSTVYSGTKHAVSAIAESLRREVGLHGVRVTCIEPGAVRTEFVERMREDVQASVVQRLGDMAQLQPEDVAAAIIYAVSQPPHVNVNILTLYPTAQA